MPLPGFLRPDIDSERAPADPTAVAAAEASRHTSFDPEDPPIPHLAVDYSEGEAGRWYPPVAERVGPEPTVMAGRDGIGNFGGTWYRVANSEEDVGAISRRLSGSTLLRWSPLNYLLKPHLAKDWEASASISAPRGW